MSFGTLMTFDTLQSQTVGAQTIAEIGEDRAFEAIDAEMMIHNEIYTEAVGDFVDITTERLRRYGGPAAMQMEQIDEVGAPQAQKVTAGQTVGFPLNLYAIGVQWTRKFMENATGKELAEQFTAAQDADFVNLTTVLKRTMFIPTNTTFLDKLVDGVSLPVKAFHNADGAPIPPGPNGETFDGATHTHYLFTAGVTLAAADVAALINTVVEHYSNGNALLYINRAQEAAFRGFTTGANVFIPYVDARLSQSQSALRAEEQGLDITQLNNRAIGIFNQAEVWVKPYIPVGYLFCWVANAPKPIVLRIRNTASGNLRIAAEYDLYPLRARALEREMGMGVWNRANGAVLYIDTGAAGAYVAPTL